MAPTQSEALSPSLATFAPEQGEHWIEPLKDGRHVLIRPLRAEDREREKAFIMRLSPESRHFRFLCQINEPGKAMLDQLMTIDQQHMAYVALAHVDGELLEIGISRYATGASPDECECAITIDDQWRNLGLASLLLGHLIDHAREHGYKEMYSIEDAANTYVHDLVRAFGFSTARDPEDACRVVHRLVLR